MSIRNRVVKKLLGAMACLAWMGAVCVGQEGQNPTAGDAQQRAVEAKFTIVQQSAMDALMRAHAETEADYALLWRHGLINMHPAPDGKYSANSLEELQTYLDLKMGYQYIEQPVIRQAMNLKNGEGIIVASAAEGGLGRRAGFRSGDVVLRVNETPVDTQYKFVIAVTENRGRQTVATIQRQGKNQQIEFELDPVKLDRRRWVIGVSVDEMSDVLQSHLGTAGAVVTAISDDSPAQKIGLQVNDVLVRIGKSKITSLDELRDAVQDTQGNPVTVEMIRSGKRMKFELSPQQVEEEHANGKAVESVPGVVRWVFHSQNGVVNDTLQPEMRRVGGIRVTGVDENQDQLYRQIEDLQRQLEAVKTSLESRAKAHDK